MTCKEAACSGPVLAWGWCKNHYERWRRAMRKGLAEDFRPSVEDRLLSRREIAESGCWVWTGSVLVGNHSDAPYGVIHADGTRKLVHRVAHALWIGPIPAGFEVDHVAARGCVSTLCFNPEHLEAVTPRTNTLRSSAPTAINARKTECIHGHPFDERNTHIRPNGKRECRACNRERARRNVARRISART